MKYQVVLLNNIGKLHLGVAHSTYNEAIKTLVAYKALFPQGTYEIKGIEDDTD